MLDVRVGPINERGWTNEKLFLEKVPQFAVHLCDVNSAV